MSRSCAVSLIAAVLVTLLPAQPAAAARVAPLTSPEPVAMEVSGRVYRYFPLVRGAPLRFRIEGPAVFEPILRWRFEGGGRAPDVDVVFVLDGEVAWHEVFRPSVGPARYPGRPEWRGAAAVKAPLDVPSGVHTVELRLEAPPGGTLDVNPVVREPAVLPWRVAWREELGAAYDSNIFRYSDADVDDFLDGRDGGTHEGRYLDDLRVEPSVDLSLVREEPGRRETELRMSADFRLATLNGEKSFARLGVRVREARPGLGHAFLEYYAIPRYHVRRLWDDDADEGSRYRSCDFRKHAVRLFVGTDLTLAVNLAAQLKYDYAGYDQDFVEYDAGAWTAGLTVIARPVRGVRLDVGYALRRLDARGYDEAGETKETSDDSDVSYEQDRYSLRVRWDAGRTSGVPVVLTVGAALARRFYQTGRLVEEDPYHAGREDTYWTFSARASRALSVGTTIEAFYEHRRRSSASDYVDWLGPSKDYTADRIGLRFILEGERFLD